MKTLKILVVLLTSSSFTLLFHSEGVFAGSPCPEYRSALDPCICQEISEEPGKRFTLVICKGLLNVMELNAVTNNLKRMALDRMVILNSNLVSTQVQTTHDPFYYERYPPTPTSSTKKGTWFLEEVIIREIVIQDSIKPSSCNWNINSWTGFYESLTSLRTNNFLSQTTTQFCSQDFAKFVNLENLDLSDSNLSSTLPVLPTSLIRLKTLDISNNALTSIAAETFSSLPLSRLNISHNKLSIVRRNIFAKENNTLSELDLSWNPLLSLPEDFLLGLNALEKLHLQHTLIQVIDGAFISKSRSIHMIDLRDNFLICNCTMAWSSDTSRLKPLNVQGHCQNPRTLEFKTAHDPLNYIGC